MSKANAIHFDFHEQVVCQWRKIAVPNRSRPLGIGDDRHQTADKRTPAIQEFLHRPYGLLFLFISRGYLPRGESRFHDDNERSNKRSFGKKFPQNSFNIFFITIWQDLSGGIAREYIFGRSLCSTC
jgi:hypothetical protein